jgi:hypothetical protein
MIELRVVDPFDSGAVLADPAGEHRDDTARQMLDGNALSRGCT